MFWGHKAASLAIPVDIPLPLAKFKLKPHEIPKKDTYFVLSAIFELSLMQYKRDIVGFAALRLYDSRGWRTRAIVGIATLAICSSA